MTMSNSAPTNRSLYFKEYLQACTTPSDINEHVETFNHLVVENNLQHVTEFGVRTGVSTRGWICGLATTGGQLHTYDISPFPSEVLRVVDSAKIDHIHRQQDTGSKPMAEDTELLFIDTLHTAGQVKLELLLNADKVSKFIVFHDTVTFGTVGELANNEGLMPAIEGFLKSNPEWNTYREYLNNNGLLIIKREVSK